MRKNHRNISKKFFKLSKNSAQCQLCGCFFRTGNSPLSNLTMHLERIHKSELDSFIASSTLDGGYLSHSSPPINITNDNLDIFSAFIGFSNLPMSLVSKSYFIEFLTSIRPNVNIPSKYFINKKMDEWTNSYKLLVKKSIKVCLYLTICLDIWTYQNKNVISATGVCGYKDGTEQTINFELKEISTQKSTDIALYVNEIIYNFNIDNNKLLTITTDNCSAMLKSIDLIQQEENLNNTNVSSYIELDQTEDDINIPNSNCLIESYDLIEDLDPEPIRHDLLSRFKVEIFKCDKWIFLGCFIHKLNLVLKHSFKENNECQTLINKTSQSERILKKKQFIKYKISIAKSIEIRWNSNYLMLDSLLKQESKYKNFINNEVISEDILQMEDLKKIKFLHTLLKNFYKIIKELEKGQGKVYFFIDWYYNYLEKFELEVGKRETPLWIKDLLNSVIKYIKKYFEQDIQRLGKFSLVYKFLSPIYYNKLIRIEKNECIATITNLFINEEDEQGQDIDIGDREIEVGFLQSDDAQIPNKTTNLIADEIRDFEKDIKNKDCSFENYWGLFGLRFERLSLMSVLIRGVGCSSGSIERVWSLLKEYSYWRRNRMTVGSLEKRLMCRAFLDYFKKK